MIFLTCNFIYGIYLSLGILFLKVYSNLFKISFDRLFDFNNDPCGFIGHLFLYIMWPVSFCVLFEFYLRGEFKER